MISIRCPEELVDLFDEAAKAAGYGNRSIWAREVLTTEVAKRNGTPLDAHTPRARQLGGERIAAGTCLHPPTARRELPFETICTLCGATV